MSGKKKATRFSEAMNKALVDNYETHKELLKAKFSPSVTHTKKKEVWERITVAVNAVNTGDRKTVDQVKRRWEDLTTIVKKKERQAIHGEVKRLRVTGNGNLPEDEEGTALLSKPVSATLNSTEQDVASILGPDVFMGIAGGIDSMDLLAIEPVNEPLETISAKAAAGLELTTAPTAGSSTSSSYSPPVPVRRKRKLSIADAQLVYFQTATEYYRLKMEKVRLEISMLMATSKEE